MNTDTNSTNLSISAILREAANYIARNGWFQEEHFGPSKHRSKPPACALGAISQVIDGGLSTVWSFGAENLDRSVYLQAEEALADHLGIPIDGDYTIGHWNDEPWRIVSDVTTALRGAADEWDRTHGGDR
jgi:hypothetical protein